MLPILSGVSQSVGCFIVARSTKRVLLGRRSAVVGDPNLWGTFGGGVDAGESLEEALHRELHEEAGFSGQFITLNNVWTNKRPTNHYHNFVGVLENEFLPKLNFETAVHLWFDPALFPRPLHPGVIEALKQPAVRRAISAAIR